MTDHSRSQNASLLEAAPQIAQHGARARELVDAHRARIDEIDRRLADQVQAVSGELARQRTALEGREQQLHHESTALEQQREQLQLTRDTWEQTRQEAVAQQGTLAQTLEEKQQSATQLEQAIAEREAELRKAERQLATAQQRLDEETALLEASRTRLEEKLQATEELRERLLEQRAEMQSQRRQIGRKLQERRNQLQHELETGRAELAGRAAEENLQLAEQAAELEQLRAHLDEHRSELATLEAERDKLAGELQSEHQAAAEQQARCDALAAESARLDEQLQAERETARQSADEAEASLRSQVEQLTGEREELTTALQASREASASTADTEERLAELTRKFELAVQDAREQKRRNAELEEELASRPASDGSEPAELIAVRSERDRLAERVVELESREPEPVGAGSPDDQVDELQQRFEMAVEDLRDYKLRCSEMEEELAGIRNGGAVAMPASPTGGSLDWEAQKKLLMDGMGGDDESAVEALSEEEQQERLSLQEAIERTERIVADKDRLIAQLERELDEQRSRAAEAAQAAANEALSDLLDEDEVIRAERRRLTELQAEWSDKLRQAEIDVSLQRATLARERTELDEKCERFSKQKERFEREIGVAGADEKSGQPSRDRWLSKLGLTRRDEQ